MSHEYTDSRLLDDDTVIAYNSSHCGHLAMALVERGYNPGILASIDECGDILRVNFTHAFVVINDPSDAGKELYVDINGIHTRDELFEAWADIAYDISMDDHGYDFDMFTGIKTMPSLAKTDVDDHDRLLADLINEEIIAFAKSSK